MGQVAVGWRPCLHLPSLPLCGLAGSSGSAHCPSARTRDRHRRRRSGSGPGTRWAHLFPALPASSRSCRWLPRARKDGECVGQALVTATQEVGPPTTTCPAHPRTSAYPATPPPGGGQPPIPAWRLTCRPPACWGAAPVCSPATMWGQGADWVCPANLTTPRGLLTWARGVHSVGAPLDRWEAPGAVGAVCPWPGEGRGHVEAGVGFPPFEGSAQGR